MTVALECGFGVSSMWGGVPGGFGRALCGQQDSRAVSLQLPLGNSSQTKLGLNHLTLHTVHFDEESLVVLLEPVGKQPQGLVCCLDSACS